MKQFAIMTCLLAVLASCPAWGTDEAEVPERRVISVKQALTQPDEYQGERVMMVGQFLGYNGSCNTPRPVTNSDIMVQNKQGLCIYVTGPLPRGFDPISKEGLAERIVLSGFVVDPDDAPPYFMVPGKINPDKRRPNAAEYFIKKRQGDNTPPLLTLNKLLTTPDKYVNKSVGLKGSIMKETGDCATPRPPVSEDEAAWTMISTDQRCLWIIGPLPTTAAEKTDTAEPVTIKGILQKSGDTFFFIYQPDQPEEETPEDAAPPAEQESTDTE